MSSDRIASLEKLVGTPRDGALLRYGLGMEYEKSGDAAQAIAHLAKAVEFDPAYSAAWSLLGKLYADAGRTDEARQAWENGIAAAHKRGDKQAEKTMAVFMKRLAKGG
ncbi:MAG: tetratricopeptide repeat protein [Burkholderiales bacterium]